MSTISLRIEGMTCGHCAAAVTQALQGIPGVERVSVDLTSGRAEVTSQAQEVDTAALIAAVEDQGYGAFPAPSPEG